MMVLTNNVVLAAATLSPLLASRHRLLRATGWCTSQLMAQRQDLASRSFVISALCGCTTLAASMHRLCCPVTTLPNLITLPI